MYSSHPHVESPRIISKTGGKQANQTIKTEKVVELFSENVISARFKYH